MEVAAQLAASDRKVAELMTRAKKFVALRSMEVEALCRAKKAGRKFSNLVDMSRDETNMVLGEPRRAPPDYGADS